MAGQRTTSDRDCRANRDRGATTAATRHHGEVEPIEPVTAIPSGPVAGRALIATPVIGDDRFARSVVLMVEHDDDGAIGVVLNHPTDTTIAEVLPGWERLTSGPSVLFAGGPVATDGALALARLVAGASPSDVPDVGQGPQPVFQPLSLLGNGLHPAETGVIGMLDLSADPSELAGTIAEVRVFAGYAGWGAGQLESELSVGAWWVSPVRPDEVFPALPGDLWSRVVGRQPGERALFARYPADPDMN
jgi:putative transcriptional regulator